MGLIDSLVGAFLLGTLFNMVLLGTTLLQTLDYVRNFWATDRAAYRWTVAENFFLGLGHSISSAFTVYDMTVTHFGDMAHLDVIPWGFCMDPVLTALVAAWVQGFYSYRVYVVSGRRIALPIIIMLLTTLQLGWGIFLSTWGFRQPSFTAVNDNLTYAVATWLVAMSVADITISVSLVYFLRKSTSKSGFAGTDTILDSLIKHTLSNNAATALTATTSAVCFAVAPGAWHTVAGLILSKLYQTSLLASLNSRTGLQQMRSTAGAYTSNPASGSRAGDFFQDAVAAPRKPPAAMAGVGDISWFSKKDAVTTDQKYAVHDIELDSGRPSSRSTVPKHLGTADAGISVSINSHTVSEH